MKFTLTQFIVFITVICCLFGAYKTGLQEGKEMSRRKGYEQADRHYKVMLTSFAKDSNWEELGKFYRSGSLSLIRGPLSEAEEELYRSYWIEQGIIKD